MDRSFIERYAKDAKALGAAIEGLTKSELTAYPVPGTWSIQQIVFHMLDSELIAGDRMKRIIAMENPLLIGYDETAFANRLFYQELEASLACEMVEKNRLLTAEILRRLPDEAFQRSGIHSERGKIALGDYVVSMADHLDHHLKFIRQKREMLGKPVA
ncbi:MAG: DinB family protein [Pirellulales bacterium]